MLSAPAWAESHASSRGELTSSGFPGSPTSGGAPSAGRGATVTYKRNETVPKLLNPQALDGLAKAGPDAAKAIADSTSKSLQQISQLASQQFDAGKDTISQLAASIPDPSSLTSSPDAFNQLAQAQQQLANTETQILQIQSQGILQLPAPQPTEAPPKVSLADRLKNAPTRPFAGTKPTIKVGPNGLGLLHGGGLVNLPQAYKAPK